MRHTLCPRCDSILSKSGHCSICGYQVKSFCPSCGHLNIPTAKFCGGCGKGTTISVRYRKAINGYFNPAQQLRIKRFFAGIAFGTLLALFAFSSMGMKYYAPEALPEDTVVVETTIDEEVLNSAILKSVSSDLEDFCLNRNTKKMASSRELNAVIDILIKNLNHIALRTNKKKRPLDNAKEYLEQERSIKQNDKATRGNCALMFFAYASDLLELHYKDYTNGSTYSDIPRFNLMDAPASALKKHNIKLAYDNERFGVNEEISLGELCDAAKQLTALAIKRANEKAPDLSAPPEIIID